MQDRNLIITLLPFSEYSIRIMMVLNSSHFNYELQGTLCSYLANTCQLTQHALSSKYFPPSLVSKLGERNPL